MACPSGTYAYIVKAGDTFYLIARAHGISTDALIAANPGVNPSNLRIGQEICIPSSPGPGPEQPCPTLRMGSTGASVRHLQELLRNAGFNPGAIDGIFGSQTHSAVLAFQKSRGLVQDGIVGVNTWTALGIHCGGGTHPGTCPAGTIVHTVRAGETFYTLASRYNTTVAAIQRANPTVNPNNLQIGQIVCIPQ